MNHTAQRPLSSATASNCGFVPDTTLRLLKLSHLDTSRVLALSGREHVFDAREEDATHEWPGQGGGCGVRKHWQTGKP